MNPAPAGKPPSRQRRIFLWLLIVLLAGSAAILTRYCGRVPASSIGFWRVAGAALALLPFWLADWRRAGRPAAFSRGALLTGGFLGVHFATWSWALQNTTIANAALFIGLQPLLAPFIARPVLGERLNRWELAACGLASVGMVWILGQQFALDRAHLAGSLVALGSAFLCACYFVFSRKYRVRQSAFLFTVPVYATAAAVQAALALTLDGGIRVGEGTERWALLGLILLPTVGGHTLSIYLLRYVKSQLITLAIPAQFVLVTLAARWVFRETPTFWFAIGAAFVLAGVLLGVLKSETPAPPPESSRRS